MAGESDDRGLSAAAGALRVALVVVAACTATPLTSSPTPGTSSEMTTPSQTPTPTPSVPVTSVGSRIGACTDPQTSSRGVLERYFVLSTSGDAAAVNDCFASVWRARNANFDDGAARWAVSGPATDLQIALLDRVLGCDRYSINARMPSGVFGFYALVGLDGDRQRIYETGTALVRPELATTRCG